MKIQFRLFFVSVLFFSSLVKSQEKKNWEPLLINVDGTNRFDDLEAFYCLSNCNDTSTVFLKFKNNNNYKLKIQWKVIMIDKAGNFFPGKNESCELVIEPLKEMKGECSVDANQLKVKLTDFGIDYLILKEVSTKNVIVSYL